MRKAGREGELVRYLPRLGEVGLGELLLLLSDRHLIVPSSRKVAELCLPFVRRNLLGRPPNYDVAFHVLVENLQSSPGRDLQKQIDRALERMRTRAPSGTGPGDIDRSSMAGAVEEALRYYGEVLKSTRQVIVTADVDPSQITLAVRAEGKPGGLLDKLIRRQRPGAVFGKELVPGSAWLVSSNRSNPEAAAERQKSWTTTVHAMFRRFEQGQGDRFRSALLELGRRFTGDLTVALHRAPSGTGLTITALAQVQGAGPAREAMDRLAGVAGEWIKKKMREEQDVTLRELEIERRPFSKHGARGSSCSVRLRYPEARRQELTRLLGERVGLAWAFKGEHALFTAGKEAEEQLGLLAEALSTGKLAGNLDEVPAFRRAHNAVPTRIGLLYVSLLDLARWFEGSGVEEAEALAAKLKKAKASSAPSVSWGVNATRSQLDVTLHLPVEHFRAVRPLYEELVKRRAGKPAVGPWPRPGQAP
jgi:hypothetical protein